jgi:CO dehydrogenase maturation factor
MATIIAVSGKGGAGKTAVAAGLVLCVKECSGGPILAVDADPNSTLGETLGLEYHATLADVREGRHYPEGLAKPDAVELGVEQALVEGSGIDLLVMGRPEGPGCYCAVNHLLRKTLHRVAERYVAVVVDNEAGMEHLSRRTSDSIAILLIVVAPTCVSLRAARRVMQLATEEHLSVGRTLLVLNRWPQLPSAGLTAAVDQIPADGTVYLPWSSAVERIYSAGGSFSSLDSSDPFLCGIREGLLPAVIAVVHGANPA